VTVVEEIAAERRRQIEKGWTPEHDDGHAYGEIIDHDQWGVVPRLIRAPLERPARARRLLVESAALIVAEIERRDRETVQRMAAALSKAGGSDG
jgi:hypothetical protein